MWNVLCTLGPVDVRWGMCGPSPVQGGGGGSGAGDSTGVGASSSALLLCSAAVLCCCALLCSALHWLPAGRCASQGWADKHTSIQAYKHTSIPPALPDHYSLLVLVNMRRYTQKQKHAYIYTNSTHTHTYTNVCGSQKQEWAFISPYENLYCTTCTHLETKQHTSLPPSLPNRFLTFDCTFEYVYVFTFTLFKKP